MNETPVPGPVPRLELPEWRELGFVAGITARGTTDLPFDMGLAGTSTPVGRVMDRWRAFQDALGFDGLVVSRQVHGTGICWHEPVGGLLIQAGIDGHATASSGLMLAVTSADCVPVYLADPIGRMIALLHAGWRGASARILARGVALLQAHGSCVDNLLLHCGVGVCGDCYEVGSEVFEQCGLPAPSDSRGKLDLRKLLKNQAMGIGIRHISTSGFCSAHDGALFFSHRASGGADGRMAAYLGMLPGPPR